MNMHELNNLPPYQLLICVLNTLLEFLSKWVYNLNKYYLLN